MQELGAANIRPTNHNPLPTTTRILALLVVLALTIVPAVSAQIIEFLEADGEVWTREQVVTGRVTDAGTGTGEILVGDRSWPIDLDGDLFETTVVLEEGLNSIIARWEVEGSPIATDTLRLTLPFTLRPEAELTPTVEGRTVTLTGHVVANPDSTALTFEWEADPNNPAGLPLTATSDSLATVTIPESQPHGVYYFNWTVTDADGDAFRARTYVEVDSTGVDPFDLATEHAPWIDRAVLYEITPTAFTFRGDFEKIAARIPEFVELGITTLWLQPIFLSTHDQGYAVLDYFTIRPAFGDEQSLHALIDAAHAAGLRVIFDFVPNHSDIKHRYAQDAIANGERSQYYDFYMRSRDTAPYSQHYNTMKVGEMTFVYYFWSDLVNFNFDDPGVQRFIIESSRYWIEEFDIDGYRFDAVWAPAARNPEFMLEWRRALKRVKPEILMLAEDKARAPSGYPSAYEAFDVAYDWAVDPDWISKWRFQLSDESRTVFNTTDSRRANSIVQAIGTPTDEPILRYLENNDSPRFVENHSLRMTRMAATLMYTLPGIPMLYNGQEVGYPTHPYDVGGGRFIYGSTLPLREHHETTLFPHYQHLNWLKANLAPLQNLSYDAVDVGSVRMLAFRRWAGDQHVVAVFNPQEIRAFGTLELPVDEMGLEEGATYYLTDLFTGESEAVSREDLASMSIDVMPETALLYAIGTAPVQVPVASEPEPGELPVSTLALQNYPNPFSDRSTVEYVLPEAGPARIAMYDVLGRRVMTLIDATLPAGTHEAVIDATGLPAGTYFVRVEQGGKSVVRMVTVVR